MRILVACEFSGIVRDAFIARGHDAWSCDLLPSERPGPHLQCDVLTVLHRAWDMMIGFPDCTYVCRSGIHWNKRRPERAALTEAGVEFFRKLLEAPIPKVALENPAGILTRRIRKWDQSIQPHQFGHPDSKLTCLWLKGLPPLVPTRRLKLPASGRWRNQSRSGNNVLGSHFKDRWKARSRTYPGIARAMAAQWT